MRRTGRKIEIYYSRDDYEEKACLDGYSIQEPSLSKVYLEGRVTTSAHHYDYSYYYIQSTTPEIIPIYSQGIDHVVMATIGA